MSLKVELLEQSFDRIRPRLDEFTDSLYSNVLSDYPQTRPLFAKTNMTHQKKMLGNALLLVVENLRQPEVLEKSLKELGGRHVKYGTVPEYYSWIGEALLKTFESYLGSDWTPEVKQAWVDAYGAIAKFMLSGSENSTAAETRVRTALS